jgi:hypothetical protein
MDMVKDALTGGWLRNKNQPAGEIENEVALGHKPLLQNDPTMP